MKPTPHNHFMGWKRDLPDHRDFLFSAPRDVLQSLPRQVDLRSTMPPVYDQGEIGSCTANAIGGAIQFDRLKLKDSPDWVPSRLFLYYNERDIEHSIPMDAGAMIRDGIKSIARSGICPEADWPYVATPADPFTGLFPAGSPPITKPPAKCYTEALQHTAVSYFRITQSFAQLRGCLAAGYPFVFGFTVYSSIYDHNGNPVINLPMPSANDGILGGHAVLAVGYNDDSRMFTCRNSWGTNVQDHGYFYMPYNYMTDIDLAADFWTVRKMSS